MGVLITRSVSSVYVTLQPPRETREAASIKREEERQAEAESFPIGAPVWVVYYPDKSPAVIVGKREWLGIPLVQVQYNDGTTKTHPQDKVRPRAVKKGKA